MAIKNGFENLDELNKEGKKLKPGMKVYRSCYGKTLFLAQIGKEPLENGLNLVGAHIDCPRLDAKPFPLVEDDKLLFIDTHYYGGIKKYQWTTIPWRSTESSSEGRNQGPNLHRGRSKRSSPHHHRPPPAPGKRPGGKTPRNRIPRGRAQCADRIEAR